MFHALNAWAVQVTVFGPVVFEYTSRGGTQNAAFSVTSPNNPHVLIIDNGNFNATKPASGSVILNGVKVASLGKKNTHVEIPVTLAANNTLQIQFKGKAGGQQVYIAVVATENAIPVAAAKLSPGQSLTVGSTVILDGSDSTDADGDSLRYAWSFVSRPSGSAAALIGETSVTPSFTIDRAGEYKINLVINDGVQDSLPDTLTINTVNSAPIANAGPDKSALVSDKVTLDGSASSDVDGDSLSHSWTITLKPTDSIAVLNNETTATPDFTIDKPGQYTAELIVNDGKTASAPDYVVISTDNSRPVALAAGPELPVIVGQPVDLDGTGSTDADNDPLNYSWSFTSFPGATPPTLSDNTAAQPSFTPNLAGDYISQLIVNDGELDSFPSTATITVVDNPSDDPLITGISPVSASIGTQVTISGSNLLPAIGGCPLITLKDKNGNNIQAPVISCSNTEVVFIVPAGAATGLITVTIDGQIIPANSPTGPIVVTVVPANSFGLSVQPAQANLLQGATTTVTFELQNSTGFTGLAVLSLTGLPPGVSATFEPQMITNGQLATLTLAASATAQLGPVSPVVTATANTEAGAFAKSAAFDLNVLQGGITALTGKFTLINGTPMQGVKLSLPCSPNPCVTETDAGGNFIFADNSLPTGDQIFMVDTTPVNPKYPKYAVTVNLVAGQTKQLPVFEIVPTPPQERFTQFDNAAADQVITDPRFPGASFTLPQGVTIIGWDGVPKTQMAIEKLSADKLPVPPPSGFTRSFYQPFWGTSSGGIPSQPIPFSAPNDLDLLPGEQAELWWYDTAPIPGEPGAWKLAGMGTVSEDGSTIVSDPGVGIPRFCGVCGISCFVKNQQNQPSRNGETIKEMPAADPVDVMLGQMITEKTDMILPGRIPAVAHRIHNPFEPFGAIAGFELGFGLGWSLSVEAALQTESAALQRLIMPGNARYPFTLDTATGKYLMKTHPGFSGATLTKEADNSFTLRHKNGAVWRFSPSARVPGFRVLSAQIDANGNALTITRNSNDKITRITEPSGRFLTFTITSNRITKIEDPIGRSVQYTYNAGGRLETVTDAAGGVTRYTYDSAGRILTVTDPKNIVFNSNEYSSVSGRILKQTEADGSVWKFQYRFTMPDLTTIYETSESVAAGLTGPLPNISFDTIVIDPRGNKTSYSGLGADGFADSITNAQGQTTVFERDPAGRILSVTDPLQRKTAMTYDAAGNLLSLTDPVGNVTQFEYEPAFNKLAKFTDALGNVSTFEYDAKGNLIATTDPEQNLKPLAQRLKTVIAYDSFGQPISITDALGNTTTLAYDANGNLLTVKDPLNNTAKNTYDAVSRLIAATDANGHTTQIAYDAVNQVQEVIDALGGVTAFAHDPNGNLLSLTDALGHKTQYTYDSRDRAVTRTDPLGAQETFEYDDNGNLIRHTDRKGQISTYKYDVVDRPTEAVFGDGSTVAVNYDAAGRLLQVSDSQGGIIVRDYDPLDRLLREITALGTIDYAYDSLDRRTAMTVAGQPQVSYEYDANSRLTQIIQAGKTVNYTYDALDRPLLKTLPNGVATAYKFDPASRLTELVYGKNGVSLGNLTYQYDAIGNRIQTGGSFARSAVPDSLASASYDVANRQQSFGGRQMSHDANGNRASLTENNATTNYQWDARDRLKAIASPSVNAAFVYDAFGRRTAKDIGGQRTDYLYDGADIVQELKNTATVNVLSGLGIDQPLLRGDNEHFLTDALGSAVALTDATGNVSDTYTYEPYGKTSGGGSDNPFQFTAREYDGTGLYYYRARYYDPVGSRFVSEDPIGFNGGDSNLYGYVFGNPLRYSDPLGKSAFNAGNTIGKGANVTVGRKPNKYLPQNAHGSLGNKAPYLMLVSDDDPKINATDVLTKAPGIKNPILKSLLAAIGVIADYPKEFIEGVIDILREKEAKDCFKIEDESEQAKCIFDTGRTF